MGCWSSTGPVRNTIVVEHFVYAYFLILDITALINCTIGHHVFNGILELKHVLTSPDNQIMLLAYHHLLNLLSDKEVPS